MRLGADQYIECSAKTGENVHFVLEQVVDLALKHRLQPQGLKYVCESTGAQGVPLRVEKLVQTMYRPLAKLGKREKPCEEEILERYAGKLQIDQLIQDVHAHFK